MKDLSTAAPLTWDDFAPGQVWLFGDYPVTEAEIIDFARRYDPLPIHLDRDVAREAPLGVFCASGIHTLGMTQKLLVDNLYIRSRLIAGGEMKHLRLHRPVLPGDRLSVAVRVEAAVAHSRRPDAGWVDLQVETRCAKGEPVLEYQVRILFGRDVAGASSSV